MGQPIPDRIKNKPILKTGLDLFYDAYIDLHNDVNFNNCITWTTIVNYCDRYEFSFEQEERLQFFIRELNLFYNKWLDKKKG